MRDEPGYFEAALSDFVYDMASGGAICHLADAGYSIDRIMKELDFPTPRKRVEQIVYRHMLENKIIQEQLPIEQQLLKKQRFSNITVRELGERLEQQLRLNGEQQSYIKLPLRLLKMKVCFDRESISCLTQEEQAYLLGFPWEKEYLYHRLTGGMLEIGKQLAVKSEWEISFYFLQTGEVLIL